MQIDELHRLTIWVAENISAKDISSLYQTLHSIMSNNAQANTQKQPFEEQKDSLISAIMAVPVEQLTRAQEDVLETVGIRQAISNEGRDRIEDLLYRNQLDVATAAESLREMMQSLTQGVDWTNQTRSQLNSISDVEKLTVTEVGEVLLRVKFTQDASIENVVEWSEWAGAWLEISRGISMATGGTPEDVRIVGAARGSFILDLVSVTGFAKAVSYILKEVLERVQQLLEIRKSYEVVRGLKIENNKAALELEQAMAEHKERSIEEVTDNSVARIAQERELDGEQVSVLKRSIARLFEFFDKGGEVDVRVPDPEDSASEDGEETVSSAEIERAELAALIEDVRRLENQIKRLGYESEDE